MTDSATLDFDSLWNFGDPAATEQQFRQLFAKNDSIHDSSYTAQLLTQIARTQGLQGQFEAAHKTLDQVAATLTDDITVARIRYLLERGRVFNSSGQRDQARPLFLQAWELAQAADEDVYAIDTAHMLAIISSSDEQMQWNSKALAIAESSTVPRARKWAGSLYNNMGWTYHDLKQYDQALSIFEKALLFFEEHGTPSSLSIAKWSVARALRSVGRTQEALDRQRALLAEHQAAGTADGYVSEEIAECLLELGHADQARPFFASAYAELSKDTWFVSNEAARLERLKTLSG